MDNNVHHYELVRLSTHEDVDVYEMLQHIGPSENSFSNEAYGLSEAQWRKWLVKQEAWSRGECLPDGYVPQISYWLYADGTPVGYGKIRLALTEESKKAGGTIGYAIDSRWRGRGYGTQLMKMLLEESRSLALKDVLLTVEEQNAASRRAIEKCGARKVDERDGWIYFVV